ncbi:MAG: isoprenylcysteine carboxylmethyltransferase family protein [Treponema sp.]|nr:isoprenylcysteine carboxylmethyltransferase family protein [Treponema sp.]
MKKQAVKYMVVVMMQRILGLACFLLAAGTLLDVRGWIYFSMYFIVSIITLAVMFNNHAETLSERGKKHENTKSWDKIFLGIYVPSAFYIIYIVAGLGVRFQWPVLSTTFMYVGATLYIVSTILGVWAIMENKHFEPTSRIQDDRNQTVITTGPYRLVRHPGYSSIITWAISVPMIFGSLFTGVVSVIIIVTVAIRTYFEDTMLKKELCGYLEYANKVKYRLIPFIW